MIEPDNCHIRVKRASACAATKSKNCHFDSRLFVEVREFVRVPRLMLSRLPITSAAKTSLIAVIIANHHIQPQCPVHNGCRSQFWRSNAWKRRYSRMCKSTCITVGQEACKRRNKTTVSFPRTAWQMQLRAVQIGRVGKQRNPANKKKS